MPVDWSRYPKDWPEISARIRFVRAKGQCEWIEDGVRCAAIHREQHPITGSKVVLTTMHLDHDTGNNEETNLLCACQLHHNRYDAQHRKENRNRRWQEQKKAYGFMEDLFSEAAQ